MKKLFIPSILLLLIMMFTSCNNNNNNSVIEKPIIGSINFDTSKFQIDTIKVIKYHRFTSSNLYRLHCQMCHGLRGVGDGVKARHDTTLCPYDLRKITKPDKDVYYIVLNGEGRMPNQYELDSTNVWVMVIYIKKFKEK